MNKDFNYEEELAKEKLRLLKCLRFMLIGAPILPLVLMYFFGL